jgi:hypothetical protein
MIFVLSFYYKLYEKKIKLNYKMFLKENIEMVVKGGKHRLVGFVDLGKIHDNMEQLSGMRDHMK